MTSGQKTATADHMDFVDRPAPQTEPNERTPWLLAFLCLLLPLLPAYVVPAGPLKSNGTPVKLIAVLFFGLAVLGFIVVRRTASTRMVRPGVVIILCYFLLQLAVYGVGLTHTQDALIQANSTRALINLVATVGIALYILTRIRTVRQRNIVLGCLTIGLTYACLVALLQSVTSIDLRFFFQPPGFVINATELEIWTRYGAKRVVGTSQVHIEFSVVAAMTVLLTIYFARNAAKREVRWAAALACSSAFVAVPAAVSRTGVIALAAALFVYMWCFSVRQVIVAIAAGCVAILTYIQIFPTTANAVWNTVVNSRDDPSVLERTADYAAVSQTFRAHPVFGLGLGGALPTEYRYLDNEWLQAIVQGGTVGLAAMIVLTGGGIFGIAAGLRRAGNTREREQAYLLGSMFVGILVSSFTFDLFSNLQATLIFYLTFGLLWCNFTVPLTAASHRASRVRNRRLV